MVLELRQRKVSVLDGKRMESAPMVMPVLGLLATLPRIRAVNLEVGVENHKNKIEIRKKRKIGDLAETLPKVPEVPIGLVVVVGVRKAVIDPRGGLSLLSTKGATQLRIDEADHQRLKEPEAAKVLGERVPQVL